MAKKKNKTEHTASFTLMRRAIRQYVRPYAGMFAFSLLLMLVSSAMTGAMAKMMEPVIDGVFAAHDGHGRAMLWTVALTIFAVFTLRGLATYGQTVVMNRLGLRVVADMQRDMFSHLVYADLAYVHGQQTGQLLSRFLGDMYLVRTAVVDSLAGVGRNAFTLVFLIGVMFYQDWKLSIVSLFVFPAAGYVVYLLGRRLRKVSASTQVTMGEMTSMLGQSFQGSKHVKAYGMEEFEKTRVNGVIEYCFKLMDRAFRISSISTPVSEVLSGLAIVTIVVYGGYQVMDGHSTAGKLFSFITAFMLAYDPMKRLAKMNNTMQMGLAALDRFYKLVDAPPSIKDAPDARALRVSDARVDFDGVRFAYPDGTEALKGVSFTVPRGKSVALVGASGAGKSTILNLIPRFFDVTGGAIRIDGQDVRGVTQESLRASMALVSQEVAIFDDTVLDNIRYGTLNASEDDVVAAAKQAAAHDFIMELPQGYHTRVGENGVKLSGGQRQRISIARAILRNAPILLLDEATSALDTTSERLVQTALEHLQKGKTTIVVAHRLSTIMDADIIYVMDGGTIVETGTHDELLRKNGHYAKLYGNLLKESA